MYFKKFPQFLYDFLYEEGSTETKTSLVTDITRNVRFKKRLLANITVYDEYDIVDGETPEIISEKFYGTPYYHWIIMLANDRYDYRSDFPMTEAVLQKHIKTAYNPKVHSKNYSVVHTIDITEAEYPYLYESDDYHEATLFFTLYDNPQLLDQQYLTKAVTYTMKGQYQKGLDTLVWEKTFEWPEEHDPLDNGIIPNTQTLWQKIKIEDMPDGEFVGEFEISTSGREHNPVYFVDINGYKVDPGQAGATGVSGDEVHRKENDKKRRIKMIDPTLVETLIRNYEEEL